MIAQCPAPPPPPSPPQNESFVNTSKKPLKNRNETRVTLKYFVSYCSLKNKCCPNEWKKANIAPIHKKGDKQLIETQIIDQHHYYPYAGKSLRN